MKKRTDLLCFFEFALDGERVGAARVGPHVGEGDLLGGPALEEQLAGLGVKEEDGEGAMQETLVDVGHEVALLLAAVADVLVVVVEHDASLLHEADLLLIVAGERRVEADGAGLSGLCGGGRAGSGGRHVGCSAFARWSKV